MELVSDSLDEASVSERVVRSVADKLDADPTELEPLYHSVSPECLDELFPATGEPSADSVRQFAFEYEDHVVEVSGGGRVDVFSRGDTNPGQTPTDPAASSTQGRPDAPD